ncbi:MAG TPA: NUDIX hydrolase [Verrucomicrobiae bacterium]
MSDRIRPWPLVESKPLNNYRIFTTRADRKVSPRTHKEMEFYVIESRHWVNIIALTEDDEIVMIEQYRHGTNSIELEIPGGIIDKGDNDPVEAGVRELLEETGFEGTDAMLLGQVAANPAIMNNTCYTVLVRNCHFSSETRFDTGEDIITRLVPIKDLPELVRSGKIQHSLVVVALFHFDLWQRKQAGK